MNITVWAPSAKSVGTRDAGAADPDHPRAAGYLEIPGRADGPGYWQIEVDDSVLVHGYRYSIDGGEPIPDPGSKWQPDGVHGASHFVDTAQLHATVPHAVQPHAMQQLAMHRPHAEHPDAEELQSGRDSGIHDRAARFVAKPLRDAVIYELHIGTFTPEGTYAAAQAKLPHLATLGVTHVELMPLATFPGRRGWGYDGVDLYAPFPLHLDAFQEKARFSTWPHTHRHERSLDGVASKAGTSRGPPRERWRWCKAHRGVIR